jgi:hypothetical protein
MLHPILINIAVFLLALGGSYAITRPIGDRRRYIASSLLSVGVGVIGGFVAANVVVSLSTALAGALVGMMIAWRRRNRLSEPPQERSNARRQSSRRPHYGISRA